MSVLRPLDKQPGLNTATILLVGTEDALLQQLADSMLKEDCASELKVHLARSLPLPSNMNRPRIDLIMFVVNLHSKYSLRNVEESLRHVDATFFLGKVGFLATGAGRESHCSVHRSTVVRLARTYRSPLLFCDPEGCCVSPCSQNAHCPPYAPGLQAWSGPSTGQRIQQAAAVAGQWVGAGLEGVHGVGSVPAHFCWGFSSEL
ncbi:centromere protein M isoform X2 [Mustela erminea]|uniref:centromere protein M isoform X2 n=1 Tax=Mustela erminea TaxID=36723 RepID=UPI001386DDF0|nr:centromere protein M isoform X2 [Mustela erminea]